MSVFLPSGMAFFQGKFSMCALCSLADHCQPVMQESSKPTKANAGCRRTFWRVPARRGFRLLLAGCGRLGWTWMPQPKSTSAL
jgi:hypothetical protein